MKGKKINSDFVNEFITNCLLQDQTSSQQIVNIAKNEIDKIDEKLKQINQLKTLRSNLIDIIALFSKPSKELSSLQKILPLFQIKNHHICQLILSQINNELDINKINCGNYDKNDINFAIKELILHNVLEKQNYLLSPGKNFKNFFIFVLKINIE